MTDEVGGGKIKSDNVHVEVGVVRGEVERDEEGKEVEVLRVEVGEDDQEGRGRATK